MGFRFRRSIKILPGVKLNINKDSTSISIGPRGAKMTVNSKKKGVRTTVGLPGSGLSFTDYHKLNSSDVDNNEQFEPSQAVVSDRSRTAMFCPACGARIQKKAKFCMNCGTPVQDINNNIKQDVTYDKIRAEQILRNCENGNKINNSNNLMGNNSLKNDDIVHNVQPTVGMQVAQQQNYIQSAQVASPVLAEPISTREEYSYDELNIGVSNDEYKSCYNKAYSKLFKKRMNRQPFALLLLASIFLTTVAVGVTSHEVGRVVVTLFLVFLTLISARRLHDLNRSAWFSLIVFIPYIDIVFIIFLLVLKGTDGLNKYGPDPLSEK